MVNLKSLTNYPAYILTTCLILVFTCCLSSKDAASADMPGNEAIQMVKQAFDVGAPVIDQHFHIVGEKDINDLIPVFCPGFSMDELPDNRNRFETGSWINEERFSPLNIGLYVKTKVMMNTMGIRQRETADVDSINHMLEMVKGLTELLQDTSSELKIKLLAIDGHYEKGGEMYLREMTDVYISNWYVVGLASCLNHLMKEYNVQPFIPVISINPYRRDAIEQLNTFARYTAFLKWVAPAMGFDPDDVYINRFFDEAYRLGIVILSHSGGEQAFDVKKEHFRTYGDPALMIKALDHKVPVVIAHSGGDDDKKLFGKTTYQNREKFLEMMQEPDVRGKWCLFGDLSALLQTKNLSHFDAIFELDESIFRHRLLYGSDYPISAIKLLKNIRYLTNEEDGYIDHDRAGLLEEIYDYNPIAYDVVVKRLIRHRNNQGQPHMFKPEVFTSMVNNIQSENGACTGELKSNDECQCWLERRQALEKENNFRQDLQD